MNDNISRRSLLQSATFALAGFSCVKSIPPPSKDRAALWIVLIAGNCRTPAGFTAFEEGQESARKAGYEVLDSIHHVRERSRFLARKEVSLEYARKQEKLSVVVGPIEDIGKSDLAEIAEGVVALWVEVA